MPEQTKKNEVEETRMPFLEHLEELRKRIVICLISIGVGFVIAYAFSKKLFHFLMLPLLKVMPPGEKLIFTNLPEAFFAYLKVAFLAGFLLAIPMVFYQLWKFISPGLYSHERKYIIPFVLSSSLFFVGGALFGYFVVFPFGFKFFLSFASDTMKALPSVKQYLSLSTRLLLAFGVIFELPIIILFLSKLGIVNHVMLRKGRKYALLLSFILAAILTPPDVITQILMALPLIVLYEISIWVSKTFGKKPHQKEAPEENIAEETEGGLDKDSKEDE